MNVAFFEALAPHLTWICLALVLAFAGQLAKQCAVRLSDSGMVQLFRSTLPLHPVVVGGLLGATLALPLPHGAGDTRIAAAIYYAAAGVCCTWIYDVARAWMKARSEEVR